MDITSPNSVAQHPTMAIGRARAQPAGCDTPDQVVEKFHNGFQEGRVSPEDRAGLLGQQAFTVWLTGLSGSGKSTTGRLLEKRLIAEGRPCYLLDGDNIRRGLNRDLGFSPADRKENIRRIAEVARLFNDARLIVIVAFISPYREDRQDARALIGSDKFIEVFVDAPISICEQRDSKGLYRKARAGEIREFTGVSAPYEAPACPDVHLETGKVPPDEAVEAVLRSLRERGLLKHPGT